MPRPKTPKIPVFKKQLDAVAALATIPADKLMDALLNSGDRRFVSLANCMGDPQMRKLSIAQPCTMNSIGVKDVAAVGWKPVLLMICETAFLAALALLLLRVFG